MSFQKRQKLYLVVLCSVFFALVMPRPAFSHAHSGTEFTQVSPDTSLQRMNPNYDPFTVFVKAIGLLIALSLLLYVALKAYKSQMASKQIGGKSVYIKILQTTYIGPKKSLTLVNALDHVLLLGVTENQVKTLLKVPKEALDEQLKLALLKSDPVTDTNFKDFLKHLMNK